jgi:peptidoglycan hydrolase CwlO-like protein
LKFYKYIETDTTHTQTLAHPVLAEMAYIQDEFIAHNNNLQRQLVRMRNEQHEHAAEIDRIKNKYKRDIDEKNNLLKQLEDEVTALRKAEATWRLDEKAKFVLKGNLQFLFNGGLY